MKRFGNFYEETRGFDVYVVNALNVTLDGSESERWAIIKVDGRDAKHVDMFFETKIDFELDTNDQNMVFCLPLRYIKSICWGMGKDAVIEFWAKREVVL